MIAASAVPAVIDALVATWQAADVVVYDGPGATDDSPFTYVLVGVGDPDQEALNQSAFASQTWPWLGHVQRDEVGYVRCAVVSWSGDRDQKMVRDAGFALLADLATAIENDPSLQQPQPLWVEGIDSLDVRQEQSDNGAFITLLFNVNYHARLSAS